MDIQKNAEGDRIPWRFKKIQVLKSLEMGIDPMPLRAPPPLFVHFTCVHRDHIIDVHHGDSEQLVLEAHYSRPCMC